MEKRLNKELLKIKENGLYPLHMPGHKRNIMAPECEDGDASESAYDFGMNLKRMYEIDITEIDDFDNLHDAEGIIKDAENRAAKLYKSAETHFLVNGSSSGILAAIAAVTDRGDKIIVSRNCHISVYNAIELNDLKPVYVYPEVIEGICGSVSYSEVEKTVINNPDAKAVIITSPTYDGVLSDIPAIARLAHEYDIPLIVDEAHGALFFMEGRSAVINGADIVINSVHKTLPALTQTALIHINGNLVNRSRVRKYLRIYQTSSPSYILMGSIDYAVEIMEKEGNRLYRNFCVRTLRLKEALTKLRYLKYISADLLMNNGAFDFDESKILIAAGNSGLNGRMIYSLLREKYSLQPEMAAGHYVLLMTTLFDTDEGIDRLISALYEIDRAYSKEEMLSLCKGKDEADMSENVSDDESKALNILKQETDKESPYTVFAYPPGIPIIVKGETVTVNALKEIEHAIDSSLDVKFTD